MPDTPPADLSIEQLEQLIDVGNKALNDYYHERACACREWPASCATGGDYHFGTWDTDAFAIALPAIIAAHEQRKQPTACSVCDRRQPIRQDGTIRRHQPPGMRSGTPWCSGSEQPPKEQQ
jgi:hypothetical protein